MPVPDGILIKGSNPRVYIVESQERHWVPDPYTLSFYGGWAAVQYITDTDLNAIPEGARKASRVPRSDGTLIKGSGAAVYVMDAGQKRWVPDPQTLMTIGGWGMVLVVADEDLNAIAEGPPLPSVHRPVAPIQLNIDLDSDLGANHWMTTHGALRADGHIDAETRTRTGTWFGGFVGGVQCFFSDANGITIGQSQIHSFGVDGTAIGRSDRTDYWSEAIDPGVAGRATALHVAHFWYPRYTFFGELIRTAVDGLRPAVDLINDIRGGGGDAR